MNKNFKSLSIRTKTLILVLSIAVFLTVIFYFISTSIILKSYTEVENNIVSINIKRLDFSIENIKKNQSIKIKDWAVWDDTYDFIKDQNKEYIENNLQNIGLVNLDVNFMAFVRDGKIVFIKAIDLDNGEDLKSTDGIVLSLSKYKDLLINQNTGDLKNGVIKTPYGLTFVSSSPVLHNDGTGPISGSLIFGNFLTNKITKNISNLILYPVSIFDYNGDLDNDVVIAKNNMIEGRKNFIQVFDDSVIGYSLVKDINNNAIAIAKIVLPRDFYEIGQDTFRTFTLVMFFSFLLSSFIIWFFLEKLIISRFTRLDKEISDISNTKDLTKRISIEKGDEIGNLSVVINTMLSELYESQEKEKESVRLEKIASENLKKHLEETEKLNKLMIGRELKMIEIKNELDRLKKVE